MKKAIFTVGVIFVLLMSFNVHAASAAKIGSTEYDSVQAAVDAATDGQTVVLLGDTVETPMIDGKNITLDLGGKKLTVSGYGLDVYGSTLTVTNGTIYCDNSWGVYLNYGNNFTLDSSAKITGTGAGVYSDLYPSTSTEYNTLVIKGEIDVPGTGIWADVKTTITVAEGAKVSGEDGVVLAAGSAASKLTVNGYVSGENVAITINGTITSSSECPTITVGSSAEIVATGDETVGLYLAGYGKTTIADGAKITGDASAVEIRAGELTINGGTFTSTATSVSVTPNGNGSTTVGAALAIAQHTTKQPIKVTINGGTFNGVAALYESNPQNNESVSDDVELEVSAGTFNGTGDDVIYSEDVTAFVTGGSFSSEVDEKYLEETSVMEQTSDGKYEIAPNTVASDGGVTFESEEPFSHDYTLSVTDVTDEAVLADVSDKAKNLFSSKNDVTLLKLYDINMLDENGAIINGMEGNYTIAVPVPTDKNYTKYMIVYLDAQGNIAETIEGTKEGEFVIFHTTHLSSYGVVGYNENSVQPRVDDSTGNPNTSDTIIMFVLLMLVGAVGGIISVKKLAKR